MRSEAYGGTIGNRVQLKRDLPFSASIAETGQVLLLYLQNAFDSAKPAGRLKEPKDLFDATHEEGGEADPTEDHNVGDRYHRACP